MPELRPSLRLRLKFAALGAVGGAMILLPLGQVLRYQSAELQALLIERSRLDPLAYALAVQRNVIGHRDVSELVLHGRAQLELERRLRQGAVDESLWALHGTLSAGMWVRALGESSAMRLDWHQLVHRITLRNINAPDSWTQHQLLVEQAVQVMDFVTGSAPAGSYAQLAGLQAPGRPATNGTTAPSAPVQVPVPIPAQAQAQHLAGLELALQAHAAELDARAADLRSQRAALLCAVAAWVSFVFGAALWAWRTRPAGAELRGGGVRLSQGRRSGDTRWQASESSRLVERLRTGAASHEVEPPNTLPPGN